MLTGLIVDLFAGGGGASTGLAMALGRSPDIAIDRDDAALSLHRVNHPGTRHILGDVRAISPREATQGLPVAILHASPECTHFSRAKGQGPRSRSSRSLAWQVVRWAAKTRPLLITVENVEEFEAWGPLDACGRPLCGRRGEYFRDWVWRLNRLGYRVDWQVLRACDYGVPTSRRRLFIVARRDGAPIVWPGVTHGNPEVAMPEDLPPWPPARDCVDWALPGKSLFGRKKPLAANTLRRVAEGFRRHVLMNGMSGENACIVILRGTSTSSAIDTPVHTISAQGQHHAVAFACLVKYYGNERGGVSLSAPMHTVTCKDRMGLAYALVSGRDRSSEVREFLRKHRAIGKGEDAAVMVGGTLHRIADIRLRMLTPRELFRAQGFPESYVIDRDTDGRPVPKTTQVRVCGNAVPPGLLAALVRANRPE